MMQHQFAEFNAARGGLLNAFPNTQATHRGAGLGMPATNRKVGFRGMTWLTFKNGVIVEGWDSWNLGRLLESLR